MRKNVRHRRGSVYLLVMGATFVVTVIGLSVAMLAQLNGRQINQENDSTECQMLAQAALEYAAITINSDPSWRTTYQLGFMPTPKVLGRGTITFKVTDTSGNTSFSTTDPTQPVKVWGIARIGSTARIFSCTFAPTLSPLDVLKTTVHTGGNFTCPGGILGLLGNVSTSGGPFSSNGTLNLGTLSSITGDAQSVSTSGLLSGVSGHYTALATPLTMPPATTYDTWAAYGTDIMWNAIPSGTIQNCLVCAASNPYGPVNPYGVYRINVPAGQTLKIQSCRTVATLLINLGSGATVQLANQYLIQPPRPDFPTMIVKAGSGSVSLGGGGGTLSESSVGANLNPASTPYNGVSNATTTDTYSSQIQGLVHLIGSGASVSIGSSVPLNGTLIADASLSPGNGFSATWSNASYKTPPMGFTQLSSMAPVSGTYRREIDN